MALWLLALLCLAYPLLIRPRRRRSLGAFAGAKLAHRGLWDAARPENSLPAFAAAAAAGVGAELDARLTADGAVVVFHDGDTSRMCGCPGRVEALTLAQLQGRKLAGGEAVIPTLAQALAALGGAPVLVELKPGRDLAGLCRRTYACLQAYPGPWAVESFHPLALWWFRRHAPQALRGQLAYGLAYPRREGRRPRLGEALLSTLLCNALSRPDFLALEVDSRPHLPLLALRPFRPRLAAWTVRDPGRMARLQNMYDLQIFEGFAPGD